MRRYDEGGMSMVTQEQVYRSLRLAAVLGRLDSITASLARDDDPLEMREFYVSSLRQCIDALEKLLDEAKQEGK